MKKRTLLLAIGGGVAIAVFMLASMYYYSCTHSAGSMLVGYTAMLLSFSVIFVAIKKERDDNGGIITFGKAFRTGLLIAFIASTIYVIAWMVDANFFMTDFVKNYSAELIQAAKASHLSPDVLNEKIAGIHKEMDFYSSPFGMALYTYLEIFPVGFLVALIAALVLMRKRNKEQVVAV
jgi:hypothetical protein